MKKLFSFFAILISVASYATIRTVCNTPATLAQFADIQTAINASATGDTIYVLGSSNMYAGFTVPNIKLTIIGPGWAPNKIPALKVTINSGCNINGTGSSGTEIQGLIFNSSSNLSIQASTAINNIRIIRNQFFPGATFLFGGGTSTYTNYLFEGNFFQNSQIVNLAPMDNSLVYFSFQNNLFFEDGSYVSGNIKGFNNCNNVLFNHNLFYGSAGGVSSRNVFNGTNGTCQFLTLDNNIFVHRNAAIAGINNTFHNNITLDAGNNSPWTLPGNTDGLGNLPATDPQMADQVSVNNSVNNPLLNFTIAAGPANNSGLDGNDMGLLYDATSSLNWTSSRTSFLPYIYSMTINNPTIPAGGTLNVTVEARKDN